LKLEPTKKIEKGKIPFLQIMCEVRKIGHEKDKSMNQQEGR
jgi:hypothetical protein